MIFLNMVFGWLIGFSAVQVFANGNDWWIIGLVVGIVGMAVDLYLVATE